jgi:hypothetical protein
MATALSKTLRKSACLYCELIKDAPRKQQSVMYKIRKTTRRLNKYPPGPVENIERAGVISRIAFGGEIYPLQSASSLIYIIRGEQTVVILQGLPKRIMQGVGRNRIEAKQSLFAQIHSQFQRLYKTLPMQRNAADEQLWNALNTVILTERYRRDRKTILPITASLVEFTASGFVVDWFGGGRLSLPTEVMEGEWNTLSLGDWFEAVLSRRAGDGRILKATLVRQIPPIEPFTDDEAIAWHAALPAADLPASKAE